jgi:TatD DNase family protein
VQIKTMRAQWEVAGDAEMPVIIHNRDSSEVMLQLLSEDGFADLRGVFHSFAGGQQMATEILDRGFFLGMSGMITFPGADNVREVLPVTPRNRLLVETDSPYLAPVPHRGKPNQPAYVVEVVKRLAKEVTLSTSEVSALTTRNFFSLFPEATSKS